ncbi:hypothetical protein V6768_02140 [Tistrella mobilis]
MYRSPRWSITFSLVISVMLPMALDVRPARADDAHTGMCAASAVVEPAATGIFGDNLDSHLSEQDRRCLTVVLNEAAPAQTARWTLADGTLMLVTPGRERGTRGVRFCRDLRATVLEGTKTDTDYVTACRVGTGPWGPVS